MQEEIKNANGMDLIECRCSFRKIKGATATPAHRVSKEFDLLVHVNHDPWLQLCHIGIVKLLIQSLC